MKKTHKQKKESEDIQVASFCIRRDTNVLKHGDVKP